MKRNDFFSITVLVITLPTSYFLLACICLQRIIHCFRIYPATSQKVLVALAIGLLVLFFVGFLLGFIFAVYMIIYWIRNPEGSQLTAEEEDWLEKQRSEKEEKRKASIYELNENLKYSGEFHEKEQDYDDFGFEEDEEDEDE